MNNKDTQSEDRIRGQIIYRGECIDNNDPLRLGRIRAVLKTENTEDREKANENFGKVNYKEWDSKDPFVYNPLLPFFINIPPKPEEYVHLFFSNITRKGDKDKFYIGGVYSSPTSSNLEVYNSAVTNLDLGTRNKKFKDVVKKVNSVNINDVGNATNGIFAEPKDIGFYGRGSSDIIIKENEVLLRSGKSKKFVKNVDPVAEENRVFIQLSKFNEETRKEEPIKKLLPIEKDKPIQYLIEYNIDNSENSFSSFTGNIVIYKVHGDIYSSLMVENPYYPVLNKTENTRIKFTNKNMSKVKDLINDTITKFRDNKISELADTNTVGIEVINPTKFDNIYPFYYRLNPLLQEKLDSSLTGATLNGQTIINLNNLKLGIKISPSDLKPGQGLVYDKNGSQKIPTEFKEQILEPETIRPINRTVGVIGGDEIYLLSHKSQNTKGKISLNDSLYGISENFISLDVKPKTSAIVRGEELMELLNLIVQYMGSHVHAYPGLSPITTATNGTKLSDIIERLEKAYDNILNGQIRIN